jgi:hypothetical protein
VNHWEISVIASVYKMVIKKQILDCSDFRLENTYNFIYNYDALCM